MKRILTLAFCFFLVFSSLAQSKHLYPSVFWEITGNGLKKPSYLFGTMHVSNKMVFHLSDSFYNAIEGCDEVALELNPKHWQPDMINFEAAQATLDNYMKSGNSDFITENSFKIEDYSDDLKDALTEQPVQINGLLYRTQQQTADYEENTYLDLYIYQTGRKLGKKPGGAEDYYETEKIVFEAYRDMAKDKNKKQPDTDGASDYDIQKKIQDAYRNGDLDMLDSLEKFQFNSPAFVEKFLYKRNEIQANSIDTILKKNSLFVGVGAAHLPGPRGVIELLRKKGYKLRPIIMQNRDAARKDAIDKMRVPVTFQPVATGDSMITMLMPGPLYNKNTGKQGGSNSWQYADMDNGSYYMLTRVKTHAPLLGQSENDVMKKVDSMLYENIPGKIISKAQITKNGYPGYDITNRTRRGDLQRYNIIVTPFEILVFRMSGNDDYVAGKEADTFFGSINIKNKKQGWQNFTTAGGGFTLQMPEQPNVMLNATTADNIDRWEYEAVDSATGNAYAVWKKSVMNNDFLEEDTFDLSLIEQSLKRSDVIDKEVNRNFGAVDGYKSLGMQFLLKSGGLLYAEAVLRGPHYYLLLQRNNKNTGRDEKFFQSFTLHNFIYPAPALFHDTLLHFSVKTPVKPVFDARLMSMVSEALHDEAYNAAANRYNYWPRDRYATFSSDSTGELVQVSVTEYPKYYYVKDSATFWSTRLGIKDYYTDDDDDDLVLKSKEFVKISDSCKGYKLVYTDTNTIRQITSYALLTGNRLYRVTAVGDTIQNPAGFIASFLKTFRPDTDKPGPSIFKDKLDEFFTDFYSSDSLVKQYANNAITFVKFGPNGINRLVGAINNLTYTDKDYFELKSKLIAGLGYIDDSTSTDEVVAALDTIYNKTADTSYFQNEVLTALARLKTKNSYALLKNLLMQDPPVFDNSVEYTSFFEYFEDSLALTKTLFPDILQLGTIEDYKAPVTNLLRIMVDSGFVAANDYEPYYNKLYFDAKIELKKQQSSDEKLMQKESSSDNNDVTASQYSFGGRRSFGNFRINLRDYAGGNDAAIGINDYSVLLSPFYDTHPAVPKFFDKQLQSKDIGVRLDAAILLIRNNKKIADSILLQIADKEKYRAKLLQELEDIKHTELFPSKYRNQDSVARAVLLNDKEVDKFYAIEYKGRQFVTTGNDSGYVYFYQYKLNKDDEWHIGLSGLQPADTGKVSSNNMLVKMTGRKLKPAMPESEQFNDQLTRLIFEQHKSAQNFFEDNNNYGYLSRRYLSGR
ncbi:MAG TPA: TraB/GumN family protein [Chitinophagaceae bacterium]|nr:TraB/GumN family protein [Chitinophagaceae bacterium]